MNTPRCGGILLHPTSLPSADGLGTLGKECFDFAEQLFKAGQTIWQMLPLGPLGKGFSPYQSFSAFAGEPLLINLPLLVEDGDLAAEDLRHPPRFAEARVDYPAAIAWKLPLLTKAYRNFRDGASTALREKHDAFCKEQSWWLDDYALFMALRHQHGLEHSWTTWERGLVLRQAAALKAARRELADQIETQKYWQFQFFRQWNSLHEHCKQLGLQLMGDVPIYVSHDSSDVWANPEQFELDKNRQPKFVAGVPPDYFSKTGQLWGNPIYKWKTMKEDGFEWWIERFRGAFQLFDLVRLDHFRGFHAYWQVPAAHETAEHGSWVDAPGAALFEALKKRLGNLELVAENLGDITPEVEELRHRFQFPGMAVLQFAFGLDKQGDSFRPHNYVRDLFAYTGTHDNDTVAGWWKSEGGDSTRAPEDIRKEKEFTLKYLNTDGREMHWTLICACYASVARVAIAPMQDVLGLGSESRMNQPGTGEGNWSWRMLPDAFSVADQQRLHEITATYGRLTAEQTPPRPQDSEARQMASI